MSKDPKLDEIERLLNDMKKNQEPKEKGFWKTMKVMAGVWRNTFIVLLVLLVLLLAALPFGAFWYLKSGSTFQESKGAFLESIQEMNELSTAEAYSKVVIERQDNAVFGQEIGIDLPGTKRQLLVVIPGRVRAGVDFSEVTEEDIVVDEEARTATLTLPKPEILGEPELFLDQVEIYSYEGLFRDEADIAEAYELAEEAKTLMMEEVQGQGVLELAEENAARSVQDMFGLVDYDVTINFD